MTDNEYRELARLYREFPPETYQDLRRVASKMADAIEALLAELPPREPTRAMRSEAFNRYGEIYSVADLLEAFYAILDVAALTPEGERPRGDAAPTPVAWYVPRYGARSVAAWGVLPPDDDPDWRPLYAAPAEPVAQPACDHDWRDRRTDTDPYALDTCCICGAVRDEAEPVAQQPPLSLLTCIWDGCDLDPIYCEGHAKEAFAPAAQQPEAPPADTLLSELDEQAKAAHGVWDYAEELMTRSAARIRTLHTALRTVTICRQSGNAIHPLSCALCNWQAWSDGEPERHKPGSLATPDSAASPEPKP